MLLISEFFGQSFNTNTSLPLPLFQQLNIGRGMFLSIPLYMLVCYLFLAFFFTIKLTKTCGWSKLLIVVFLNLLYDEDKTSFKLYGWWNGHQIQWGLSTWQWQKVALHGHAGSHENYFWRNPIKLSYN